MMKIIFGLMFIALVQISVAQKIHVPGGKANSMPGGIIVTVAGDIGAEYRLACRANGKIKASDWFTFVRARDILVLPVSDRPTTASQITILARDSDGSTSTTLPDVRTKHVLEALFTQEYVDVIDQLPPNLEKAFIKYIKDREKAEIAAHQAVLDATIAEQMRQRRVQRIVTTDTLSVEQVLPEVPIE